MHVQIKSVTLLIGTENSVLYVQDTYWRDFLLLLKILNVTRDIFVHRGVKPISSFHRTKALQNVILLPCRIFNIAELSNTWHRTFQLPLHFHFISSLWKSVHTTEIKTQKGIQPLSGPYLYDLSKGFSPIILTKKENEDIQHKVF